MDCDNDCMCEKESRASDKKDRKKKHIFRQYFKHFSISFFYAYGQLHKLVH